MAIIAPEKICSMKLSVIGVFSEAFLKQLDDDMADKKRGSSTSFLESFLLLESDAHSASETSDDESEDNFLILEESYISTESKFPDYSKKPFCSEMLKSKASASDLTETFLILD
jgi:hypothetical protein